MVDIEKKNVISNISVGIAWDVGKECERPTL